jgi:uncharacterized protein YbjT (DUF2867 family)
MRETPRYLVTGAAGRVSRLVIERLLAQGLSVRAMVRRDDDRAEALRDLGAEVVIGDLTDPRDVAVAVNGVARVFFNMSVSPEYLEATAVLCASTRKVDGLEILVNMSQMTVAQMTATSTGESHQQQLHWLSEQVINWTGLPAVHVRPTVFLDNPLFTMLAARSIAERHTLGLPFGPGRSAPVAATDVANVVATILQDPAKHVGAHYELTGPEALDVDELADRYSRALDWPVVGERLAHEEWVDHILAPSGLNSHVQQHISTMATLHRNNRYDRSTGDVLKVTGNSPQTVEQYVRDHIDLFQPTTRP